MVWMSLLERAERSNLAGVMARVEEQVQPLCAVYSRTCASYVCGRSWKQGRLEGRGCDRGREATVEYVDLRMSRDWFRNLNTAEDLARATIASAKKHISEELARNLMHRRVPR